MCEIEFPAMNVKMISISQIRKNFYNPNHVAEPELKLLEHSIREDGFTQPIVCYFDGRKALYIIVDGFHRYEIAKNNLGLKYIPVVVIKKDLCHRIASTVRHNRAKGVHEVNQMSDIVRMLSLQGWSDEMIGVHLGMEKEEVFRLKQTEGLKTLFSNHKFSDSWVTFEEKYYNNNQNK